MMQLETLAQIAGLADTLPVADEATRAGAALFAMEHDLIHH